MTQKKTTKSSTSTKSKNTLTEVLNAVTMKKPCDYNPKDVSAYVLSLFLSESPGLIETVNEINTHHFDIPDELIFKYYVGRVPKGYRKLTFTKKTKEAQDREKQIKMLMEEYGMSKREANLSI